MNISSILITILGIIIILALYVLSRTSQSNLPNKEGTKLPDIKDAEGNKFTSVLDDIPATDDSSPKFQTKKQTNIASKEPKTDPTKTPTKKQLVLFISAKDETGLDGSLVKQTLLNNNLKLGDKDIYHYYLDKNEQMNSLFRVANGVEPWTLTDKDLVDKQVIGISVVMLLPNVIDNKEAASLFLKMADTITQQVNGVLKNQQQEILSITDRAEILKS